MHRLLITLAALALCLSAAFPAAATAAADTTGAKLDEFVARALPASGVPGLSYAVVTDGGITSVGAHGVMRKGGEAEVTADTPFLLGSIAKSFTALAVMQLVEADEIGLDTAVAQYLDSFEGRDSGAITIRQLLSHTSGYSTFQGNTWRADSGGGTDELEHRVDQASDVTPAHEPDERWEYSNLNYQVLGRVIEVVSGEEYQTYVTSHVLEPVGMEHSFVADGALHESMATGHRPWFGTKRPLPTGTTDRTTAPQGGIVASAGDLALYLQMMMNEQDDVLSAAGKAAMMKPASGASPHYGLGWFIDRTRGSVWHSGTSPGFETLATMVPATHRAVVVLLNGGSGLGFGETTEVREGITALALGEDVTSQGSRWAQKTLYVSLVLLPIVYLLSIAWAWRHRRDLRAKSGVLGTFSLWFPVLTTGTAAWVILSLVPRLFGVPLRTLGQFQPDLVLALVATAVTGVLWATVRLAVAHTGRSRPDPLEPSRVTPATP